MQQAEHAGMKILILGGTAEARHLAGALVAEGHEVITSLAGRTQDPKIPQGKLRMGRFGGVPGLFAYLQAAEIDYLVDATHPYAGQMSRNAVLAAEQAGVPLLRVKRAAWTPPDGHAWHEHETIDAAAEALPTRAQVLLTTGHAGLETFLARDDCRFIVRLIEAPAFDMPSHADLLLTRPPFTLKAESELMQRHGITHLVSKNSGGSQTAAKLQAAAQLGISVFMLARPIYDPALEVESVGAALEVLRRAG